MSLGEKTVEDDEENSREEDLTVRFNWVHLDSDGMSDRPIQPTF